MRTKFKESDLSASDTQDFDEDFVDDDEDDDSEAERDKRERRSARKQRLQDRGLLQDTKLVKVAKAGKFQRRHVQGSDKTMNLSGYMSLSDVDKTEDDTDDDEADDLAASGKKKKDKTLEMAVTGLLGHSYSVEITGMIHADVGLSPFS